MFTADLPLPLAIGVTITPVPCIPIRTVVYIALDRIDWTQGRIAIEITSHSLVVHANYGSVLETTATRFRTLENHHTVH